MIRLLNLIKNNQKINKSIIYILYQKNHVIFLNFLWDNNLISGYKSIKKQKKIIKIFLKYINFLPAIINYKILSKPKKRFYLNIKQLWKIKTNKGIFIISTSKGLQSLIDCKKNHVGGEPLIYIK